MDLTTEDPVRAGPYRLVSRIGAGGMGVVYLAISPSGQQVAVKLVRPELASDATFRPRFRREVEAGRRVSGLRTAHYLDADIEGERPYLVSEFVEGGNLADHVTTHGPLQGDQLVSLAVGLAEAIVAIHALGVIHRDLKPSNVLMSPSGPKVVDFGISHAMGGSTALTQTAVVMGSPAWMAPEQALGRAVTPAVDVFAWGATVVFAATGKSPFGEGRPDALIYRIVHEEPELQGVGERLRPVVARALAKDPERRPSADDVLVSVVKSAMAGSQLPIGDTDTMRTVPFERAGVMDSRRKPRRRALRPVAWVAAAILLIAAFTAGSLYVQNDDSKGRQPVRSLAPVHTSPGAEQPAPTQPVSPKTATTTGVTTTTSFTGFDYQAATVRLRQLGYRADSDFRNVSGETGPLYALTGSCSSSATGYCQNAFFFHDNAYLGTDISGIDLQVSIAWVKRDLVALSYPLYAPGDPDCCPTGGTRTVRFEWNGSRVVPLNPLPPFPNSTTGQGSILGNSGNTGNSGNSGNT